MDMLYYEQPVFVLFPILLSVWQIAVYFIKKKIHFSYLGDLIVSCICVVGHAAAITVILMNGGTFYHTLLLVLLSGVISLFLSPKANTPVNKTDEEDKS